MQKVCIIFGGTSTEHEVSVSSATSVIENIDKNKYSITPIYIDKNGTWYKYNKEISQIKTLSVGEYPKELEKISNIIEELKKYDVAFPILHGLYGEDGTIQGLFELLNIKYVGCKVLSSSLCMDKVYTKLIFEESNINQAKYLYIKYQNGKYIYVDKTFKEKEVTLSDIDNLITNELKYPVFIKPSNSGSSVGINKAYNKEELEKYLSIATNYDKKILIEETIIGKEVECAVLGKNEVIASSVGEIQADDDFYSYDAKYQNKNSKTIIPAPIAPEITKEIQTLAIKAFKAVDGSGLSRVDFFIGKDNKIYINEINAMPGFTSISMYPKLFEYSGINYKELIDKLIELS